ncbi:MAG: hypothetical protein QQN63_09495, partial [Nitrosopumilus sp.]
MGGSCVLFTGRLPAPPVGVLGTQNPLERRYNTHPWLAPLEQVYLLVPDIELLTGDLCGSGYNSSTTGDNGPRTAISRGWYPV